MQYKSHHRFAKLTACQNFRHFGFGVSVKRPRWEKTTMEKDHSGKRPQYIKDRKVYIGKKTTLDKRPHEIVATK